MNKLITIVGPTAVGKTELTISLAKWLHTSVISGDAYQIYKELNIGSAKPTVEEMDHVPHYLIDALDPFAPYSVAIFQKEADYWIDKLNKDGKVPILAGGTGLYVQALLEGYHFPEGCPQESLRNELDTLYEQEGLEGLIAYGEKLSEEKGVPLPFKDKHRLYRAIELMVLGQEQALVEQSKAGLSYGGPVIGLMRPREELYERINERVRLMIKEGLVDEVERLYAMGLREEHQAMKGIGYKEFFPYFRGEISLEETVEKIQQNTRRFAKRQITWYKRMPYIEWIHIDKDMNKDQILSKAKEIIHDYKIR